MKLNSHKQIRTKNDKESIHSLPFEYDPTPLNENEGHFYTRGMEIEMTLNELGKLVNANARNKGFYKQIEDLSANPYLNKQEKEFINHLWFSNRLLLIISEVCEGFEGLRNGNFNSEPKSGGLMEELGDTQIRLSDLIEDLKLNSPYVDNPKNFEEIVIEKHQFNTQREYKHGGKKS